MNANHLIELTVQEERADPLVVTASHFSTLVDQNASTYYSIHISGFFNIQNISGTFFSQELDEKINTNLLLAHIRLKMVSLS